MLSEKYILPFLLAHALILLGGCASSLPTDYPRTDAYYVEDTDETHLGQEIVPVKKQHAGNSGFYPLSKGIDAFVARVALIEAAEKTLDVQYYIWHTDLTGKVMIDRLLHAADRGVRVRLLLDDLDTAGKDFSLAMLDAHPNIEIRLYNPFANRNSRMLDFVTDLGRVNRRMHNKSLTADNQATIVGGRNIGNEYFGAESHVEFADLDVLAVGTIVDKVSTAFDEYWNSDWVMPIAAFETEKPVTKEDLARARPALTRFVEEAKDSPYAVALRESALMDVSGIDDLKFSWGRAKLIYDAPSKVTATEVTAATHMGPQLGAVIKKTRQELIVVSPYFVPGDKLTDFFGELVEQGIRVRILTNSLSATDVSVVHAGYMRYRKALLKRGVELYEYKPVAGFDRKKSKDPDSGSNMTGSSRASLHAKTFGIDRRVLFVGSFNLDPRSVDLNTEMGVVFESPELAGLLGESIDNKIDQQAYRLELKKVVPEDNDAFNEYKLEWVTIEDGREVRYSEEPESSIWRKIGISFLTALPIESQL